MIDVSDGLAADLGHILEASGVGAQVELGSLPLSPQVRGAVSAEGDWGLPLASGDDYELCFCLPPRHLNRVQELLDSLGVRVSVVGRVRGGDGLSCLLEDGSTWQLEKSGYEHFSN
jgi:thiamine-monophosphate kinase